MPIIWESPPPETVYPGEVVTLHFSDGYIIFAVGHFCHGISRTSYPTLSGMRTVHLYLDGVEVLTSQCPRICEIEWTIPEDLEPGLHTIRIGWEPEFQIRVE